MKLIVMIGVMMVSAFAEAADFGSEIDLGVWKACFDQSKSTLSLVHAKSGARICGHLAFAGPRRATDCDGMNASNAVAWQVVSSRDGVRERLALLAPNGNVQGCLAFQKSGDRLSLLLYHRTALAYDGALLFPE